MEVNDIIVILIIAVLVMFVYRGCKRNGVDPVNRTPNTHKYDDVEHMAPLDFGTFVDNYPRGECRTGKYWERSDCEVGNCNLGTTIDSDQFCRIQCAQDPDPLERQECFARCIDGLC